MGNIIKLNQPTYWKLNVFIFIYNLLSYHAFIVLFLFWMMLISYSNNNWWFSLQYNKSIVICFFLNVHHLLRLLDLNIKKRTSIMHTWFKMIAWQHWDKFSLCLSWVTFQSTRWRWEQSVEYGASKINSLT